MRLPAEACDHCGLRLEDVGGHRVAIHEHQPAKGQIPWHCYVCNEEFCWHCGGPRSEASDVLRDNGTVDEGPVRSGGCSAACVDFHTLGPLGPDNVIAIVYAFESCLTPLALDECLRLPEFEVDERFWERLKPDDDRCPYAPRAYLSELLTSARHCGTRLSHARLVALGRTLPWAPGVVSWVARVNAFIAAESRGRWSATHHLVARGLRSVVGALPAIHSFNSVTGSDFYWEGRNLATRPRRVILADCMLPALFAVRRITPVRNIICVGPLDSDAQYILGDAGATTIPIYGLRTWPWIRTTGAGFEPDFRAGSDLDQYVRDLLRQKLSLESHTLIAGRQGASR